ncbi:Stealth CR1 domain-containing protein [Oribacterium sp. NK2B42]|uniref:Stealth CR1 domain-containing protein n=1 Tax=Oribacterium sp. NK2B42 TaxID=689781 RepID=UPI0003FD095E|nr:Stealth CR1 domain-containing protein [Oribacterium sp. NK2B42]
MERNDKAIDIVVPWVDSNDPLWRAEKNKFAQLESNLDSVDARDRRYRDWDTIKYLLRSIDLYMPWVRKVFFITWGHIPSWLNKEAEKLVIVNHRDFIPEEYLPTFSANPIELNIHRIEGLSENFIYFNDDLLVLKGLKPTDFFVNGLPRDYAALSPINTATRGSIHDITLTDVEIINSNFKKSDVIEKAWTKWFSPLYGTNLFRTICLLPWPYFTGFLSMHQCNPFLKSTFEEVWDKEFAILDYTCRHRFRARRDVNQWLMRYWQIVSGKFEPIKPYGKVCSINDTDNGKLKLLLSDKSVKTVVINDNVTVNNEDTIREIKEGISEILEELYPQKSSFEI